MFELVDLHTHSHHSDGVLAPAELVARAALRKLTRLALTDHDTTAGLDEARAACQQHSIAFVNGTELTTSWRGQEVHIVGLDIDPSSAALQAQCATVLALRRTRIAAIGGLLQRLPALAGEDLSIALLAEPGIPTRLHVARELVRRGLATGTQDAFDRFLARKRPGYVGQEWPTIESALTAITAAGGHAVLAHAHRYKFSAGVPGELCRQFKDAGGVAIEVSLPGTSPADTARLIRLARQHGLAGSMGSDFHEPGLPWRPLGRFAKLPDEVASILDRLRPT